MPGRGESPGPHSGPHTSGRQREPSTRSTHDTMDRDGVLATLGYKPEKSWRAPTTVLMEKSELCIRCGKKVYPVEKIDVGGLYHRSCFRCRTCNVHLNLRTFHRDVDPVKKKQTREIYCKSHVPQGASAYVDTDALEIRRALDAQKNASVQMRRTGYEHESHYTPDAMEFRHQAKTSKTRKKVRRRSTLSHKDFEKYGVYDAQSELEEVHKQEEDELYKQMYQDRKRHVNKLERYLSDEMKRTVKELIAWFEKRDASEEEKKLGINKIENFYHNQREERMQLLLHRLTMEEQAAVARMIEKHSQEMLLLIQEKEREAEKAMKFEFRESQLLEDGRVLIEEDDEDEYEYEEASEEEVGEVTESFSEASYRVEQVEQFDGHHNRLLHSLSNQNDQLDKQTTDRNTLPQISSNEFERQGSQRGSSRQRRHESHEDHAALPHPGDKNMNRQSSRGNHVMGDNRYPPEIQGDRRQHGRHNSHMSSAQNGTYRHPSHNRALQADSRGLSLSQQLLNVNPPLEDLHFGVDDDGAIVVKVHAAQNAHAIGDDLRSHHYCTDPPRDPPTVNKYYDLSKSPKALRPRTRRPEAGETGSPIPGTKASQSSGKDPGKYMLFQRPEDLHGVRWSDDSWSDDGSATGKSGRKGKGHRGKENRDSKKSGNKQKNGQRSRSRSRERSHDGSRGSRDELTSRDLDENLKNKTKTHADRAREALRAMSLGIGDDSTRQANDDVFFEITPIAPKISPPKSKKKTLYTSPVIFKEFDENAIRETKREHKTFTELVRQLSKRCESEIQRVRSIFRWVTAKDLNKLTFSDNLDSDTPMGLLRGIKLGVETYHNLFKRLCSYAGIHCEIVEGYSKGAGYKPGGRFQGNQFRNQWTAVCIDGAWRFVNCNWGARHVKGPRDDYMTYKCDEFYFLTDPEEHIFQHYPDDLKWQLIPQPITIDQFVKLPVLKSPFFNKHLGLSSDYESNIHTSDGNMELRLSAPKSLGFAAKLKSKDGHVRPEVLQDRVLIRRVKDQVIFLSNLPSPGNYFLEIYCGDDTDADAMDNACAFRIRCYGVSQNAHISFPPVGCFGRTPFFKNFDIREETHSDPYVTHNGELLIALLCKTDLKLSHSMILWNHRDRKFEEFDRYAFVMHRSDNMISYIIHCPRRGGYMFSLLASTTDSTEAKCIYRYYIECRSPSENSFPLPKASKRWLNCRLVEPTKGDLPLRTRTRFRIESAAALELVISINGAWLSLQKSGNLWQGYVNTGDDKCKLCVYGRFDKGKEKYIPLLEYQVRGSRDVNDEVRALMKYL